MWLLVSREYRAIRLLLEQSVKQSSLLGSHPILILYIHPNPIYIYKIHDTERCFFVSRDHAAKVTSEVTTEVVKSNVADGVPHCGLSEMPDDLAEPGPASWAS